jgi:hypothetical protein
VGDVMEVVKQVIGIILYHIGDLASKLMLYFKYGHLLYSFYNWCMKKSIDYNSQYWDKVNPEIKE